PFFEAARFSMHYPSDRYSVAGIDLPDLSSGWLALDDTKGGEIAIGLVHIAPYIPDNSIAASIDLRVHLVLAAGSSPGGEVSCDDLEFSDATGVPLAITLDRTIVPIGGPVHVELSPNRPNPSNGV